MSLASVQADLAARAPDLVVQVTENSTATVQLAAEVHGVEPGQIAKTLCIRVNGEVLLLVTRGDARLDNAKAKAEFGGKVRMMTAEEVVALTGHPIGGVCPFGLATPLPVHCDVSLQPFDSVIPAAGSAHSAVRIAPQHMMGITAAIWVDVCR